ncbi:hypothetical protein V5O48_003083 [Marasmius crinis-equi]|uniref:S-adenosylmethionine-dependent methyltransferase n=1 Tax=Marasmius crinis-equi TaxID=585013 RepID=A0ABR3FTV3_9AGAR
MPDNDSSRENLVVQPPTAHLPSIKQLEQLLLQPAVQNQPDSLSTLRQHLEYLRSIYNPPVRGAQRRGRRFVFSVDESQPHSPDPASSSAFLDGVSQQTQLEIIRSDAFEQSYALRWLSALLRVAQKEDVTAFFTSDESEAGDTRKHAFSSLIDTSAALLASCSGTSGAGVITRDFVFSTGSQGASQNFPDQISVSLTDRPLDNADFRSVGAQTWGGACVLAEELVQKPSIFFGGILTGSRKGEPQPFRVLELGAGTGLVSLAAAKVCEGIPSGLHPTVPEEIVATDYYPPVLQNLEANIATNFPSSTPDNAHPTKVKITTQALDWEAFASLEGTIASPLSPPFDLVLGADIIYETLHAQWIRKCLHKLLRQPTEETNPRFHLMIPLRPSFAAESGTMESVFPFVGRDSTPGELELVIFSKEIIICGVGASTQAGSSQVPFEDADGDDIVRYAYYVIGWGVGTRV